MFWSGKPFVWILLFLLSGILIAVWIPVIEKINFGYILAFAALLLLVFFLLTHKNRRWKYRSANGMFAGLLIVTVGILLAKTSMRQLEEPVSRGKANYTGKIVKEPVATDKTVKLVLKLDSFDDSAGLKRTSAKVMIYIEKDSLSELLGYGDKLVFNGLLRKPEAPKNPGEYDYKRFLELNGIAYVTFVRGSQWKLLEAKSGFSIFTLAASIRQYLLAEMKKNGIEGEDFAVAAAVLLGYDNLMDHELQQDYKAAGVMHVLVVSGLHVGIIYLVLNFLLGFLNRNRFQVILKMFLLLFFVWSYSILTGLAPSIQRSAVMITMFIVASAARRSRDNFNTLAASAVLLIIVNPMVIFNVGFQLSYVAVFGILFFFKPIHALFHFKNKLLFLIWEVLAVSISAQLATFPIAAHYFHFFPNYFWLSNIFIFPLSFFIITAGMFFVAVFWIPGLSVAAGFMLAKLVFSMNFMVGLIKFIPFHGLSDLYFPWIKVVIVYSLIFFLFYWLFMRKIRMLLPAVICIFILVVFQLIRVNQLNRQNSLIIFNLKNSTAIDFVQRNQHVFLADSLLAGDEKKLGYYFDNYRVIHGLDKKAFDINNELSSEEIGLYSNGRVICFNDHRLLFLNESDYCIPGNYSKPRFDAVLISGKKAVDLLKLSECFTFQALILDGTVPEWKRKKILKQGEEMNISVFDTNTSGAYTLFF